LIVAVLDDILKEASQRMPISFVHPFLIEIYASVSVGWFANLLQNLKVDLRALLANVPSHLCPKINTTSLNE